MEKPDFKFVDSQLKTLTARVTAMESYVRGEKGAQCPECEAPTAYYMVGQRQTAPGGYGAIGKQVQVHRCAMCGHEETD